MPDEKILVVEDNPLNQVRSYAVGTVRGEM
jgi:hypothetical protein